MEEIKISVLLDNNLIQANGLSRFTFIPSGRPYVMYTLNEKSIQDGVPLNKVYVSEEGDKTTQFQPISQDEWVNLKNIMAQLGEANVAVPNNIQLSQLNPTQYVVGPYKKIAINDNVMNNILTNQINNQPKEEQIARPSGTTQFFDPSLNVSAVEEDTVQETQVPNAFDMAAPVPEEAAPISLVQDQPATPVAPAPTAEVPVTAAPAPAQGMEPVLVQAIEPAQAPIVQEVPQTIEQPVQAVEMPQPIEMPIPVAEVQPVPQQAAPAAVVETTITSTQPVDDMTIVKQALQTVLDYCNGDMNKLTQLLNEQGLNIVVQDMSVAQTSAPAAAATVAEAQPAVAQEAQEEYPEPVTSVMDINNLPVVEQEAPAEENVLSEESFEPTAPTLPIDNMEAASVVNSLPDGVIPGGLPNVPQTSEQVTAQPAEQQAAPVAEAPVTNNVIEFPAQAAPAAPTVAAPVADASVANNIINFPGTAPVDQSALAAVAPIDNIIPYVADTTSTVPTTVPASTPAEQQAAPVTAPVAEAPVANNIIEFPAQPAPAAPVQAQTTEVPVANNIIDFPTQQAAPATTTLTEVAVPEAVQPVQFNQPVVETTIIDNAQPVTAAPVAVEAVQNTEVNIAVPQDIGGTQPAPVAPIDSGMGMPPITPLTQEDKAPIQTLDMSQPAEQAEPMIDTSTFLDAGPVIVPVGQEGTASQGLPGDSGAKVLERVA